MQHTKKPHTTFAERLVYALDNAEDCPPLHAGRLNWVAGKMKAAGQGVSTESVRRWFAGSIPRQNKLQALADILDVDEQWLMFGSSETPNVEVTTTNGPLNLVTGIMQMQGIIPVVPESGDKMAQIKCIHLRARVDGYERNFHIAKCDLKRDRMTVRIPVQVRDATILVVCLSDEMCLRLFTVSYEDFVAASDVEGTSLVATFTPEDECLNRVTSFGAL